jgi:ribosome-binding factor A
MVSQGRASRIAQRIKEELSELLLFDVSDPRLSGVQVTHVRVDRELAYANIFFSALEGWERKEEILEGLDHAYGYLRHQLIQRIQLHSFPQLRFNWDPLPEHADRIDKLIAALHDDDRRDEDEDR